MQTSRTRGGGSTRRRLQLGPSWHPCCRGREPSWTPADKRRGPGGASLTGHAWSDREGLREGAPMARRVYEGYMRQFLRKVIGEWGDTTGRTKPRTKPRQRLLLQKGYWNTTISAAAGSLSPPLETGRLLASSSGARVIARFDSTSGRPAQIFHLSTAGCGRSRVGPPLARVPGAASVPSSCESCLRAGLKQARSPAVARSRGAEAGCRSPSRHFYFTAILYCSLLPPRGHLALHLPDGSGPL